MTEKQLSAAEKAKIASKAQAEANKALRRRHEAEHQELYQAARRDLTAAALQT